MEKAFNFIASLTSVHSEFMGYPTIKKFHDFTEVWFKTTKVIRNPSLIAFDCDRFVMYSEGNSLVLIYTFYHEA